MSSQLRDLLVTQVKKIKDIHEHVKGNEQATKQSLIGPIFTLLGYDLTDPRECIPEYKADFGPGRSNKPVDWAFFANQKPIFFVEAKDAGKRVSNFDEQLADYFAKSQDVKLGILTNGLQWRFFTDVVNSNIMDPEPFLVWDVLADENLPLEVFNFLAILQKSQYNSELIKAFAQNRVRKNLLVSELNRLLEPSSDFVKLAVGNLETRKLTENVVEYWKPIVANAVQEWARMKTLSAVIDQASIAKPNDEDNDKGKIVTTEEELAGFEILKTVLGAERPVAFEDTASYFKLHFPGQPTWVIARFYFSRRNKIVWFPLEGDKCTSCCSALPVKPTQYPAWSSYILATLDDLKSLQPVIHLAYDEVKKERMK